MVSPNEVRASSARDAESGWVRTMTVNTAAITVAIGPITAITTNISISVTP